MRLCIVQSVLPQYAISFFNRIVERNQDIELFVLADIKTAQPLNQFQAELCRFNAVHLEHIEMAGVSIRPKILERLREINPDVVVFSASPRELMQLFVMIYLRMVGKPVAMWGMFHRIGGPKLMTSCYFKIVGAISQRCLTYTRIGALNLISLGVCKSKISVIGTAIDEQTPLAESATRTKEELESFRSENGLIGKKVVLQVVRLSRVKKPELLLEAARILANREDVVFILIGEGEMRTELEGLVREYGLKDKVRFLGAIYDEAELSRWYLSAHVFVVPTFMGLSAHHAMSYGVPVVTDDSLDNQGSEFEILAPGLNSKLYREGDVYSLAAVLNEISSNQKLHSILSENALRTVTKVHTLDQKTKRFVENVRFLQKVSQ